MRTLLAVLICCLTILSPVQAQLVLPGAVPAQGAQPLAGKGAGQSQKRQKPAAVKTPGEDAIVGRDLMQNGARGHIQFSRTGEVLSVTALQFTGSQVSKPDDACQVDVVSGTPLSTMAMGRPAGTLRYGLELEACPFSFDVLDGAILVGPLPNACVFQAADCRIDPAGLWGPRGASIGPDRIKEIERERGHAEATMRENFRDLLARTSGNPAVKAVAREQAGFTSVRSEICRDYSREDVHGFCALMLTQARAIALKVDVAQAPAEAAPKRKKRRK